MVQFSTGRVLPSTPLLLLLLFTHIQHIVRTYDSRQSCLWSAEQGGQIKSYGITYRPELELVEKEAKSFLRPEMNRKWAPSSDRNLLVQGKSKIRWCALLTSKDGAQEPQRCVPLTKGTRSDNLSLSVMPVQPDIAGMLAKPNEES